MTLDFIATWFDNNRLLWQWYKAIILWSIVIYTAISQFQVIAPKKSGYFCDDQSIRLPYKGDTVSTELVLLINLLVAVIAIIIIEKVRSNSGPGCFVTPITGLKPCLKTTGRILLDFLIGFIFVLFLNEVLKTSVSEHRPHFIYTCKPNVTRCSTEYITNYVCTNPESSKSAINDSFKSFPSSHATLSFFTSVFTMLYIHIRARTFLSRIILPWLHLMLLTWALFCSASRITDHRHHWWDVLVGGILGTVFAVATVGTLCNWFRPVKTKDPQERRLSTGRLKELIQDKSPEHGNDALESNHL